MSEALALHGGTPVRTEFLPFHRPWIEEAAIKSVAEVLESGWITRGPRTEEFEEAFRRYIGCRNAIGLNSCTAGLHLSLAALGIGPGDEVITSPITFPATANVIIHQGARPVFADVEEETLNLDPRNVEEKITSRTRAIIPVHFAGHPCQMDAILDIAERHRLAVIEDAAHAIEASYRGRKIGTIGLFTAFSFYATKNLTTGEGGMLTTTDEELAEKVRVLSLHGISHDAWKRYAKEGSQHWEAVYPGYKYNMFDLQGALGLRQLERVEEWWRIRRAYVQRYRAGLGEIPGLVLLGERADVRHAYHLLVIIVRTERLKADRDTIMAALRAENIGVGLHFRALHLHPYYRQAVGFKPGDLATAERASERVLSLPLYPKMTEQDVSDVIEAVRKVMSFYSR
ncbi:MAG: DegT/DnrJ/EryC1/StrS aminotransferase family protein [candidate division NC10 bacterium]|nr:DegT/DnrJ/EryC1/StrS aminotransferase family protein [candidate division NC10 bacterium]MDE2321221.1 DegT/DnrJ/EryC1/StrS aminotransferase family protein [candidate division NC10 bacterium]